MLDRISSPFSTRRRYFHPKALFPPEGVASTRRRYFHPKALLPPEGVFHLPAFSPEGVFHPKGAFSTRRRYFHPTVFSTRRRFPPEGVTSTRRRLPPEGVTSTRRRFSARRPFSFHIFYCSFLSFPFSFSNPHTSHINTGPGLGTGLACLLGSLAEGKRRRGRSQIAQQYELHKMYLSQTKKRKWEASALHLAGNFPKRGKSKDVKPAQKRGLGNSKDTQQVKDTRLQTGVGKMERVPKHAQ
jgi:hypothetical protein